MLGNFILPKAYFKLYREAYIYFTYKFQTGKSELATLSNWTAIKD